MRAGLLLLLALQVQTGVLRLQTEPGTELVWEDVSLGRADARGVIVVRDIPLGRYPIELRKEGFESRSAEVVIDGYVEMEVLLVSLEPAGPPEPEERAVLVPGKPASEVLPAAPSKPPVVEPPAVPGPGAGSGSPARTPPPVVAADPPRRMPEPEPLPEPVEDAPEAVKAEPAAPEVMRDEAAALPDDPAPPVSTRGLLWVYGLMALAALGGGYYVLRRMGGRPLPRPSAAPAEATEEVEEFENLEESAEFLEALKRRERELSRPAPAFGADEVIIDVEVDEVN